MKFSIKYGDFLFRQEYPHTHAAQLIKQQFGTQQKIVGTAQLFQHSDLDVPIQTATELLDSHFEIRWFIDIHRIVDNMCFVVLCPEAWEELESTFGEFSFSNNAKLSHE